MVAAADYHLLLLAPAAALHCLLQAVAAASVAATLQVGSGVCTPPHEEH